MIQLADGLTLDDNDLSFETYLAAGPGGQNVNKVATAVRLRFGLRGCTTLTEEVKARLEKLAGSRMTTEGVLVIEARRYRTQDANRQDALRRLIALIQQALVAPKVRKPTKAGATARAARRGEKERRSETKRIRSYNPDEWE